MNQNAVLNKITLELTEQLKKGVIPWRKMWSSGLPRNKVTGKHYNGVNFYLFA